MQVLLDDFYCANSIMYKFHYTNIQVLSYKFYCANSIMQIPLYRFHCANSII